MKKISLVAVIILGLSFHSTIKSENKAPLQGTITLSGAWALYPMAVKWAEEYQKLNPGVKIDISAGGAGKGIADALAQVVDIGMVSRDIYPEEISKGAWYVAVTKDAVVPVMNEMNPVFKEIQSRGVKKEIFIGIWITEAVKTWGQVSGTKNNAQINVYTRSDACGAAEVWAKYLGKKQEDLRGVGVYGDPGIAEAIRRDVFGIGFNNINYAYDSKTHKPIKGLKPIPLDLNDNGKLDPDENFYGSLEEITKAIAINKYPSPPARELYFVCKGNPQKPLVRDFIKWVLTDGQKYVQETGYINLSFISLQEQLKKLDYK